MSESHLLSQDDIERDQLITLVRRARAGDNSARDELLVIIRPHIRRVAQQKLNGKGHISPRFDASDVTQATLIDVVHDLRRFLGDSDAEFHAWLKQTLDRNVVDVVRAHLSLKRDARKETPLDSPSGDGTAWKDHLRGDVETPSEGLMRLEAGSRLEQALGQLPKELAVVVRLKEIQGLSMAEIAVQLGYNVRTVYRRYEAGLKVLTELLSDET